MVGIVYAIGVGKWPLFNVQPPPPQGWLELKADELVLTAAKDKLQWLEMIRKTGKVKQPICSVDCCPVTLEGSMRSKRAS